MVTRLGDMGNDTFSSPVSLFAGHNDGLLSCVVDQSNGECFNTSQLRASKSPSLLFFGGIRTSNDHHSC